MIGIVPWLNLRVMPALSDCAIKALFWLEPAANEHAWLPSNRHVKMEPMHCKEGAPVHKKGLEDALCVVEDPVRDCQRLHNVLGWDPALARTAVWPELA